MFNFMENVKITSSLPLLSMTEPQRSQLDLLNILRRAQGQQGQLHKTVNYDLYSLIEDEKAVKFIDEVQYRKVFNLLTSRIASTNKLSPRVAKALNRRIRAMILKMKIFISEDEFAEGLELDGIEMYANIVNFGAIDGYRGELATTQRTKVRYEGLPGYAGDQKKKRWGLF